MLRAVRRDLAPGITFESVVVIKAAVTPIDSAAIFAAKPSPVSAQTSGEKPGANISQKLWGH
jgi:hypothetical protein